MFLSTITVSLTAPLDYCARQRLQRAIRCPYRKNQGTNLTRLSFCEANVSLPKVSMTWKLSLSRILEDTSFSHLFSCKTGKKINLAVLLADVSILFLFIIFSSPPTFTFLHIASYIYSLYVCYKLVGIQMKLHFQIHHCEWITKAFFRCKDTSCWQGITTQTDVTVMVLMPRRRLWLGCVAGCLNVC